MNPVLIFDDFHRIKEKEKESLIETRTCQGGRQKEGGGKGRSISVG